MNHLYIYYRKKREDAKRKMAEILNENISCFEDFNLSYNRLNFFLSDSYFFLPLFYYWKDIKGLKYKRYIVLEDLSGFFAGNKIRLFSDHLEVDNNPNKFYYVENFTSEDILRYLFHYN